MLVAFRNVKPHPKTHQCAGDDQRQRNWLAKCKDSYGCAKKGGG